MNAKINDQAYLRAQYATDANLATRIRTHELYTQPPHDFIGWILDHVAWRGDEQVLDAGCGAGAYVEATRARTPHYIAGDLSFGMLASVDAPRRVNLNALQLPFAAGAFDVVLANHMIYHLPDRDRGVAEFARVLRPGGRLLAATNSAHSMGELHELPVKVAEHLAVPPLEPIKRALGFTLEEGATWLRRHFAHVERHDLDAALVFPAPGPVIDYLASSAHLMNALPEMISADEMWDALRAVLDEHIAAHGEFRVSKRSGVFVCWND